MFVGSTLLLPSAFLYKQPLKDYFNAYSLLSAFQVAHRDIELEATIMDDGLFI